MKKLTAAILAITMASTSSFAGNLEVTASDVDDRIDIYVNGEHQNECTWSGNPGCFAGVEGQASGTARIRFKLTNYVYNGFCLSGGCGKYAADLRVRYNGRTIWSENIYRRNNTRGVKYDKTITCYLSAGYCD